MNRVIPAILSAVLLLGCAPGIETLSLEVNTSGSTQQDNSAGNPSKWKSFNAQVLYYSNSAPWEDAFTTAANGDWTEAIDKWIAILSESSSMNRRISAEYNIALGCYLVGERALAEDWLKQAIADCKQERIPYYIRNLKVILEQ